VPVILAVGIVVLSLAIRDIRVARRARTLAETAAGVEDSYSYKNSQSYRILQNPQDLRSSKDGSMGFLDANPILMVVVIIVVLIFMAILVMSSVGSTLMLVALTGLMIDLAFVSGPTHVNILEFYARKLLSVPQAELSAYDAYAARIITRRLVIWNLSKGGFAFSFLVTPLLSMDLLPSYLIVVLFAALVGLGAAYNITRAIYAEPAKDLQKPDEQWVNRLLSEIELSR